MPGLPTTTACALGSEGGVSPAELFRRRCEPPPPPSSVLPQERSGIEPGLIFHEPDAPREDFAVQPISPMEATFRHSGWRHDRERVWSAMLALHVSRNRLNRFANCGSGCVVEFNHDQNRLRLRGNYCHDRWCLPCSRARARFIASNLLAAVRTAESVRAITLTLRHTQTPLAAQIDRIYACFKQLKAHPIWKSHVGGGAAFLEIVQSQDRSGWHPHLHVIAEGTFFPHEQLSRTWYEITGDSSITFIQAPRDFNTIGHYVCKYATKAAEHTIYDQPEALAEAMSATRGRHLCQCFGTWRGVELTPKAFDGVGWVRISSLNKLLAEAQDGNAQAQRFLSLLRRDSDSGVLSDTPPP